MFNLTLDTSCFSLRKEENSLLNELLELQADSKILLYYAPRTLQELMMSIAKKKELPKVIEMKIKYRFRDVFRDYLENMDEIDPELEWEDEFHEIGLFVTRVCLEITDKNVIEKLEVSEENLRRYLDSQKNHNSHTDIDIFTFHVMNKGNIFLTKDVPLFVSNQKTRETLENKYNTKIRLLNKDFIEELKNMIEA
ncbi:MAG: hypothetical protein HYU56_02390 [Candidatus Aenigmarchaeota archaeon]|nr:hypothetical protein [Candidatus Aenigmarchaeota archaeon]